MCVIIKKEVSFFKAVRFCACFLRIGDTFIRDYNFRVFLEGLKPLKKLRQHTHVVALIIIVIMFKR